MAAPVPATTGGLSTTSTVTAPSGVGDYDIVAIEVGSLTAYAACSGFSVGASYSDGTNFVAILYKRHMPGDPAEPASYTLTGTATATRAEATRYTGAARSGNPFRGSAVGGSATAATATPSLTQASLLVDDLAIYVDYLQTNRQLTTLPTGSTRVTAAGVGQRLHVAVKAQATAGSSGAFTGTLNGTSDQGALLAALMPANQLVSADFAGSGSLTAVAARRVSADFAVVGTLTATAKVKLKTSGTRVSNPLTLSPIREVQDSLVEWTATVPAGTTMAVATSIDDGTTWQSATNGAAVPGISPGDDLIGKTVRTKVTLTGDGYLTPTVSMLRVRVTQAAITHTVVEFLPSETRFNLGIYLLTTPDRPVGKLPATYQVHGYDKLYLLSHEVGDTYTIGTGTGYLAAVRQALTDAGVTGLPPLIDSTAQGKGLEAPMVWHGTEIATTWLRVINDLLAAINYRGLWVDPDGRFRSEPYQRPQDRAPEWLFDMTDPETDIVLEDRTFKEDEFAQLNWWRFIRATSATPPTEGDGIYTIDRTMGAAKRPKVVKITAADQASLVEQGDQIYAVDTQQTKGFDIKTGPMPLLGHFDVYSLIDPELGPFKTQSSGHSMQLKSGAVTLTLEVVS